MFSQPDFKAMSFDYSPLTMRSAGLRSASWVLRSLEIRGIMYNVRLSMAPSPRPDLSSPGLVWGTWRWRAAGRSSSCSWHHEPRVTPALAVPKLPISKASASWERDARERAPHSSTASALRAGDWALFQDLWGQVKRHWALWLDHPLFQWSLQCRPKTAGAHRRCHWDCHLLVPEGRWGWWLWRPAEEGLEAVRTPPT